MALEMFLKVVNKDTKREHTIGEWERDRAVFNWFEDRLESVESKTIVNGKHYPVKKTEMELLKKDCETVIALYNQKNGNPTEEDVGSLKPLFDHTFEEMCIGIGYKNQLERTIAIADLLDFFDLKNNDLVFLARW